MAWELFGASQLPYVRKENILLSPSPLLMLQNLDTLFSETSLGNAFGQNSLF